MLRRCAFCSCLLDLAGETGPVCGACLTAPGEDGLFGPMIQREDTDPPRGIPCCPDPEEAP
jgi:hypothetical protein